MKAVSRYLSLFALLSTLVLAGASFAPKEASAAVIDGCTVDAPSAGFSHEVHQSADRARVWRLYQAVFLRQPDRAGFDYWTSRHSAGMPLSDIAVYFTVDSREFVNLYSTVDNAQFVDLIYRNVLCRTPDAAGFDYWVGRLNSGTISRPVLAILFSESHEYLQRTTTCYSSTGAVLNRDLPHCDDVAEPVPLAEANYAQHGYEALSVSVNTVRSYPASWSGPRSGEGAVVSGSIVGTVADVRNVGTSLQRCEISSVNSNWLTPGTKDSANPISVGWGVVDGAVIPTTGDLGDRGVLGFVPKSSNPQGMEMRDGNRILQGYSILETEDHHLLIRVDDRTDAANYTWDWAVGGITTIFNGDFSVNFNVAVWADSYTMDPGSGQSFAAVDTETGRVFFGTATGLHAYDVHRWLLDQGYDNAVKFDGGGSTEYNVAGAAVVAGTPRHPMWFGVGC